MKNYKKILALMSLAAAATVTFAACGETQNVPPEHTHTYSDSWKYDEQSHWHEATCAHDWMKSGEAAHSFTDVKDGTETCTEGVTVTRTCTCGYSYTYTSEPLGHSFEDKEGLPANCEHGGYTAYRECSRCHEIVGKQDIQQTSHNYHYEIVTEDEEGNPIDKHQQVCGFCEEVKPNSLEDHSFGTEYLSDATNHWQACVCGKETEKAAHTFEQKKYASDDKQHWFVCDVCGEAGAKSAHDYDDLGLCECGARLEGKDYFAYEANGEEWTVTGFYDGDLEGKTGFAIPEKHEGKAVTAIAAGAFSGNTTITRIVLPASVKTVGDFAFQNCTALEEVSLPGVTKLGTFDYQVFNGCEKLKAVTLPAGVTEIGQSMFKNCKDLAEVTINGKVTKIDTQAFYGCEKLGTLTLSGVTYIGQKAFAKSGLSSLSVEMASKGRIAEGAFEDCKNLTELSITGGIEYFASPVLAGCEKLQTLTLPFVGNYNDAAKATDTHFGYIFGKAEGGAYVIPATLKTVNVKGGSVELGAFENCGALTVNADAAVKVKTKTFTGYKGTFTWKGTLPGPTLSDVQVDRATIFTDESVTLSYKAAPNYAAPNTTTVNVTVTKDGAAAVLNTDYTVAENVYTFKTAGAYTLTVTATYNGIEDTKTVTVTVELRGPNLSDVTVSGVEDGHCNVGSAVGMTFTFDGGDETAISYSVTKDGEPAAESTDYTVDRDQKTITFQTAGEFTVEVKATRNGKQETKSFTVVAIDPEAAKPTISSFTASDSDVTEGDPAFTLTLEVSYAKDDSNRSTNYKVFVKEGGETYSNADASYYTLEGSSFRALVAGDYKITVTVITAKGAYATSDLTFTVKPVVLDLALAQETELTNGWLRAATSGSVTVNYTLGEGVTYLDGYEVTYGADVEAAGIQAGSSNSVELSLAEANTVHFTVVYTHKTLADKVYTLTIPVSFVTDLENAPVLGEDPFGGTYGELLNSLGLQLYWNVTDGAEGEQLTLAEISYAEVAGANTTQRPLIVEHVTGNAQMPWYVMVNGFTSEGGTGYETGKVAVKLTATKNGATAAATKFFDVTALSNADSAVGMNAYADKVMGEKRGALNFDEITSRGHRENMVITKEGLFEHRTGGDWEPDQNGKGLLVVTADGGSGRTAFADNFQLDFEYEIVKRTKGNTKASFCVNYRTGAWEGYVSGQTAFYAENGDTQISAGYWSDKVSDAYGTKPEATIGKVYHIRLIYHRNDPNVVYQWQWSENGEVYNDWFTLTVQKSTENGKIGSPIYAMQFNNEQGSYYLGNFKVTTLGN